MSIINELLHLYDVNDEHGYILLNNYIEEKYLGEGEYYLDLYNSYIRILGYSFKFLRSFINYFFISPNILNLSIVLNDSKHSNFTQYSGCLVILEQHNKRYECEIKGSVDEKIYNHKNLEVTYLIKLKFEKLI